LRTLLVLSVLLVAGRAIAGPLQAVNEDRTHLCGRSSLAPLVGSSTLDGAARQLAGGSNLQGALQASGYLAVQSAMIHAQGAVSDAELAQLLAAHYCRTLQNPAFVHIGVERRGREIWMVLAQPLSIPAKRDLNAVAGEILARVNEARATGRRCGSKYFGPVGPLTLNESLTRAAQAHSEQMARFEFFDHRGQDGSDPAQRVERAGYRDHLMVGENIAAGAASAREVTEGWLASPAHCENIMEGRFREMGVAFSENPRSTSLIYWTQDFGARR
jgi:uncharacterized protein YkwD